MGYFEERNAQNNLEAEHRSEAAVEQQDEMSREKQFEALCRNYKNAGKTGFIVTTNLSQEDDMDDTYSFLFGEPKAASYDRYVKTASTSSTKAMRTFVLDNICEEQRADLETLLIDYPAMGISLGEKLLYMLGLSKTTTVRRL